MKAFTLVLVLFLSVQCQNQSSNEGSVPEVVDNPSEALRNKKYKFAVISDMNGSYGSKTYGADVGDAVKFITNGENQIQFVISTGDMVAGQRSNLDYKGMWNAFNSVVTNPIHNAKIPLMPSPGNHDAHITREVERGHYKDSWKSNNSLNISSTVQLIEGVEQNFPFQYAFKVGGALFVALDNTAAQPWKESTLKWLENLFEKEKETKLKFIYGHIPLLPFAFKKEREYVARGDVSFLNGVEALFEKYKVDVFFSGHSHVYYPGRRNAHTEYISVPLLGGGTRYLTSTKDLPRSKRGFLVIEFDDKGNWSLDHRLSKTYELVEDSSFPEYLDLPASNTSKCKACSQFPKSHFLDASKRIIYRRSDLE